MNRPLGADVVIVGGGSSGAVLAARLSEDPSRSVLLIEAGAPDPPIGPTPAHLLPIGPGSPRARSYVSTLAPAGAWDAAEETVGTLVRGCGVGGSGAVNGAYFVRATARDLDGWGSALWTHEATLPYFARSENDADFGAMPGHGAAGPVPVRRRAPERWRPVTARFAEAARAAGYPDEADKNGAGPAGIGPVPCNIADGMRVDPATAYLGGAGERPNLTVWTGVTVRSVALRGGAAVGVRVHGGGAVHTIGAGTVVLAAGAIETPALLWRSGIGAPGLLGADTAHALPGVGREFADHPEITIPYAPADEAAQDAPAPILEACLTIDDGPAGAVEIRPYTASFGAAVPGNPPMPPVLGVALMAPRSRGTMRPDPAVPWGAPLLEHRYLTDPHDAAEARAAVELAQRLLAASGIGAPLDERPPRLGTSQHMTGTCPMGDDPAAGAVVDERLRVHGLSGLFLADTSVFPHPPARGPHATAVMLAERAAEFVAAG